MQPLNRKSVAGFRGSRALPDLGVRQLRVKLHAIKVHEVLIDRSIN